jgi:hypothetical protein
MTDEHDLRAEKQKLLAEIRAELLKRQLSNAENYDKAIVSLQQHSSVSLLSSLRILSLLPRRFGFPFFILMDHTYLRCLDYDCVVLGKSKGA